MNNESDVTVSSWSWNAEVKKVWGPEWNKPELEYEFSNGRKFYRRTEESAIYATSPDH
jgi:hypothetical protein